MAYIDVPDDLPGIRGLLAFRPEMTFPLRGFMEVLMRDENMLSRGERELIATYVSHLNDCWFCQSSHGATAEYYLQCDVGFIASIKGDLACSDLSDKMKLLLTIAAKVQQGGKQVSGELIAKAKNLGITDNEIHDTVLIAAAFCMFNRYVDGLNTWAPDDPEFYRKDVKERAEAGYSNYNPYR
jgi:uncharacterized peroxidase-related enzyme